MIALAWYAAAFLMFVVLFYHRASLIIWTISCILLLALATKLYGLILASSICWIVFLVIFIPLNFKPLRRSLISRQLLNIYKTVMPTMSRTEREAISAGTITWEGDLFRGAPNWHKFLSYPSAKLTAEEQAFIEGPVECLCEMIDDWDITHNRADIPPSVFKFIKEQGFFALIIPKKYGGKEFSAYAHSQILTKISGRSVTVYSTIAVPNSLGPAELLLHYGTEQQKNYYLPRLAKGEEIPCFALTSADAGSDAGSMSDYGIICWQIYNGEKTLGIRINWAKRYITLAPIATVIGLAFKLYDPDHLLGSKEDIGITCALIPRHTLGVTIGRRHLPLNAPFMNGPILGKDVFIPLDFIIGGVPQAGRGWLMLMECLATGRAISLPASGLGGAKVLCYVTGAYARIRKQFNMSIGRFEGVEEPLARIGAYTYIMNAASTFVASSIVAGEKPSVASAIVKYHVTEMARKILCDSMDIHGGKGICLGPKNYLARGYQSAPIGITVEGANILTRSMIIFGQGALRCHPYVLRELEAAKIKDPKKSLLAFDATIIKHLAFGVSNIIRSLVLGLTGSYLVSAPAGQTKRYFQHVTRFSSALALIVDVSMLTFGGNLKRKESVSARLGDILSHLYLLSAVLKQYHEHEYREDFPLVCFAAQYCLYEIQIRFDEIIKNFPNKFLSFLLRILVFPWGKTFSKPKDTLNHKIAQLLIAPTDARNRLSQGAFLKATKENVLADIEDALIKTIAAEEIEKRIRKAKQDNIINEYTKVEQTRLALEKNIINEAEFAICMQAEQARQKVITVDDFVNEDLVRVVLEPFPNNVNTDSARTHG